MRKYGFEILGGQLLGVSSRAHAPENRRLRTQEPFLVGMSDIVGAPTDMSLPV